MTVSLSHLVVETDDPLPTAEERIPAAPQTPLDLEMAAFYVEIDQAIAAHSPVCTNRGHCCRFGEFGHRLFVTDVELRYFRSGVDDRSSSPSDDRCPYHIDGVCTARARRPLGCRIFFCDPDAQSWQPGLYESGLRRLKEIGGRHGIRYRYREWLSALASPDA